MIVTLLLFVKNVSVSRKMEPRVEKKYASSGLLFEK